MSIGKVSFRGAEAPAPQPQTQEKPQVAFEGQVVDEEKSNAAKWMIGATALAAGIALAVAGNKGYLGKSVQKLLVNAEKTVVNNSEKLAETTVDKVKFEKGIAKSLNGENYTGNVVQNLKNGDKLVRKYENGVLKRATRFDGNVVISNREYMYDSKTNKLVKIIDNNKGILFNKVEGLENKTHIILPNKNTVIDVEKSGGITITTEHPGTAGFLTKKSYMPGGICTYNKTSRYIPEENERIRQMLALK